MKAILPWLMAALAAVCTGCGSGNDDFGKNAYEIKEPQQVLPTYLTGQWTAMPSDTIPVPETTPPPDAGGKDSTSGKSDASDYPDYAGPITPPDVDGKDGKDGKDGIDGENGKDSKDSKDGMDGKDGKDGKDGNDGNDDIDGTPSIIGPTDETPSSPPASPPVSIHMSDAELVLSGMPCQLLAYYATGHVIDCTSPPFHASLSLIGSSTQWCYYALFIRDYTFEGRLNGQSHLFRVTFSIKAGSEPKMLYDVTTSAIRLSLCVETVSYGDVTVNVPLILELNGAPSD